MELIVDESGRVHELGHGDGTAIAIRALGLGGVRVDQKEMFVTWDVQRIEHNVFQVLRKLLAESHLPLPVRLCFYYGGWAEEGFHNNWSALDRLDRLAEFAEVEPPKQTAKIVKGFERASNGKIRSLSNLWRNTEGRLQKADLELLKKASPNFMALEQMRFGFIGENTLMARVCKTEDIARMIGRPYNYDPAEPPFARSVINEYQIVQAQKEPHYDHVCAPIRLYGIDHWLRYERLICPFTLPNGREILTVMCQPTQHIDVPFLQFQTQ